MNKYNAKRFLEAFLKLVKISNAITATEQIIFTGFVFPEFFEIYPSQITACNDPRLCSYFSVSFEL